MFIIILQTLPTKALLVKEKLNVKAVWMIGRVSRKAGKDREGRVISLREGKQG